MTGVDLVTAKVWRGASFFHGYSISVVKKSPSAIFVSRGGLRRSVYAPASGGDETSALKPFRVVHVNGPPIRVLPKGEWKG